MVVGETKTPVDKTKSWLNGARDIHDIYEVEAPSFFTTNVLSFATEGREFHYGAVGQPAEQWLMWGATTDPWDLAGGERVMRSVELLLSPAQVLSILQRLRPLRPAKDRQPRGPPEADPTLPAGRRCRGDPQEGDGPDPAPGTDLALPGHREDTLDGLRRAAAPELTRGRRSHGSDRARPHRPRRANCPPVPDCRPARLRVAGTKEALQRMLAEDQRGIIVTTIFRFKGAGFLNDRPNIIVLVDEAHRTQEGRLGQDLRIACPTHSSSD